MAENEAKNPGPISTVVESPEPWQRVVKASIDRAHFDKEYTDRLKKAAKSHQKPGFRKGRAPLRLIQKRFGADVRESLTTNVGGVSSTTRSYWARRCSIRARNFCEARISAAFPSLL